MGGFLVFMRLPHNINQKGEIYYEEMLREFASEINALNVSDLEKVRRINALHTLVGQYRDAMHTMVLVNNARCDSLNTPAHFEDSGVIEMVRQIRRLEFSIRSLADNDSALVFSRRPVEDDYFGRGIITAGNYAVAARTFYNTVVRIGAPYSQSELDRVFSEKGVHFGAFIPGAGVILGNNTFGDLETHADLYSKVVNSSLGKMPVLASGFVAHFNSSRQYHEYGRELAPVVGVMLVDSFSSNVLGIDLFTPYDFVTPRHVPLIDIEGNTVGLLNLIDTNGDGLECYSVSQIVPDLDLTRSEIEECRDRCIGIFTEI